MIYNNKIHVTAQFRVTFEMGKYNRGYIPALPIPGLVNPGYDVLIEKNYV